MSARNFYQTFYQTDSLFRLADESWHTLEATIEPASEPILEREPDLLAELDILSEQSIVSIEQLPEQTAPVEFIQVESILVESTLTEPVQAKPKHVEPVVITSPELLPQPAPRPKIPSTLPPVQQPRLPQLNHKVLLLADEELDPSNLLFLEKILKAVNLNVNGVDLLNLHGARDLDFAELLRGKLVHHFITFGVPFERINLDIMMDRYAPVRFEGITFLMADSLPTIEADQNLKKRLWGALQRVFLQR